MLGQYFFTSDKLDKIKKDAIHAFTSRSGYNKNMAKVIRDSPVLIGGASFT